MSVHKNNTFYNTVFARRWMFSSALTAVTLAAMTLPTQASDPTHSWLLNQDAGSFTTDASINNVTNIKLDTDRAIGSGDANIYTGHTVNVDGKLLAVRDTKSDPTQILGNLNSNGKIIIIDANGVFFGKDSVVDVAGIVATTGNIDNNQLLNNDFGDYVIESADGGSIELNGVVNIAEAGLAAFVSPFITNNGIINAKLGNVVMASGEIVTLDLYGDGMFEIAVDGKLSDALIENKGVINAEGGTVQISALAAKDAVDNIINMEGIINVASATQIGGKIILSGGKQGKVEISGTLAASGETNGGSIKVTGQNVNVTEDAIIVADAGENGNGGNTYFYGNDYTIFSGTLSARGGTVSGNGGYSEISAGESVGYSGLVDLSAANGETGTLLIDPKHLIINDTYSWLGFKFGPSDSLTIYDQALANTLHVSNVNLWATETLGTGSDIDISEYDYDVVNTHGTWKPWKWTYDNYNGITSNTLTVAAPEVNLIHDITLGNGALNVADLTTADSILGFGLITPPHDIIVDHLNLDGRVYKRASLGDASFTTLADDSQINTTADTINVQSSNALIQQAIQFADESDAEIETINVSSDIYTENLLIDKAVKLTGQFGAILQYDATNSGSGVTGNLITVTTSDVDIDPFIFDGLGIASNGVYADGADNLIIDGNIFFGFTDSNISINNSSKVKIFDNTMIGADTGIFADNAYDIKIYDNTIIDADVTGIHVQNTDGTNDVNDVDIWGNIISSSNTTTTGILVENSAYATVGVTDNNPFASGYAGGNKISGGRNAIVIADSDHSVTRYNTIDSITKTGISIIDSDNATVSRNSMAALTTGVLALSSDDLTIDYNGITGTVGPDGSVLGDGIFVQNSKRMNVNNNTITNVGDDGIQGNNTSYALVYDNIVINPVDEGIVFIGGGNSTVTNNTLIGGQTGVRVISSHNITITNNDIRDQVATTSNNGSGDGVNLENVDNAVIDNNTISGQSDNGISIENGSDNAIITNNTIDNVAEAGISVIDSSKVKIFDNIITGADTGIFADNAYDIKIYDNTIIDADVTGIHVQNTDGTNDVNDVDIWGNIISSSNTTTTGILVENSAYATVGVTDNNPFASGYAGGNKISGGRNAIVIADSDHSVTRYNTIDSITKTGVSVIDSWNALIDNNDIDGARNGIRITNSDSATISDNEIDDVSNTGIYALSSDDTQIVGNEINDNGASTYARYGILVKGGNSVDIDRNKVEETVVAGIAAYKTSYIDIDDNLVKDGKRDGVLVSGGHGADIRRNIIKNHGDDGIDVQYNNNVEIEGNVIIATGLRRHDGNGIEVSHSRKAVISDNRIVYAGDDGIDVEHSDNTTIELNRIKFAGDDGINVKRSDNTVIALNRVKFSRDDGINVNGGRNVLVDRNRVAGNGNDGIDISNNRGEVRIIQNIVSNNQDNGIEVRNANSTYILDNDIYNNGAHGLAMLGGNNGNVVLTGNDFTDNPIGALFESGYIDISDLTNPNSFTNTDPTATPVGMQFDEVGTFGSLSLVGNTLGATEFTGFQTAGSFYVRLEDGSFLDSSSSPIMLNGLNATFDGITPSSTGGILTAAELGFIENRLFDADDSPVNGRGQIFVGATPANLDNIEDFFNQFYGFNARPRGLNVTIMGLPSVGAFGTGAPGGAAALNLITPAAGGDEEEQTPDELANIEPDAGGKKAPCWGDAINAASGGATVTYSFSGTFEETLADASACSMTTL